MCAKNQFQQCDSRENRRVLHNRKMMRRIGDRPTAEGSPGSDACEQAKQHQVPHLARQHQLFILNNTTIEYDRGKKPAASVLAVFSRRRFFSPRASATAEKHLCVAH